MNEFNAPASWGASPRKATLAVIIPTYMEEAALPRLFEAFDKIGPRFQASGFDISLIFIDDNSPDATQHLICQYKETHPNTQLFVKSGPKGKDASILAVLPHITQDAFSIVDADLQDPLEVLLDMSKLWAAHPERAVRGQRVKREESAPKVATARAFYAFSHAVGMNMPENVGDFGVYPRDVAQDIIDIFAHKRPFLKAAFAATCADAQLVPYVRPARSAGETSWNYGSLMKYASGNILAHSELPTKMGEYSGAMMGLTIPAAVIIGGSWGTVVGAAVATAATGITAITSLLYQREENSNHKRIVPQAVLVDKPTHFAPTPTPNGRSI